LIYNWFTIYLPLIYHYFTIDFKLIYHWFTIDLPLIYHWFTIDLPLIYQWFTIDFRFFIYIFTIDLQLFHFWLAIDLPSHYHWFTIIYFWYIIDIQLIYHWFANGLRLLSYCLLSVIDDNSDVSVTVGECDEGNDGGGDVVIPSTADSGWRCRPTGRTVAFTAENKRRRHCKR